MYATNPAIAPVIIPSFIDINSIQLYLYSNHITTGAIKQSKNIKEYVPINGIIVITPATAPKNALNIDICLKRFKSYFII